MQESAPETQKKKNTELHKRSCTTGEDTRGAGGGNIAAQHH